MVRPRDSSLARNVPLVIQFLGLGALLLVDGHRVNDAFGRHLGTWILVCFAFYLPVILLVQRGLLLGMLMIPKTVVNAAMVVLASRRLFQPADRT